MHFTDRIHLVSRKCLLPFLVLIRILQDPMLGIYPSWEVNRRERERIWIGCCVLSESVNYIEGFEVARKAVIMYYASNADTMMLITLLSSLFYTAIHIV